MQNGLILLVGRPLHIAREIEPGLTYLGVFRGVKKNELGSLHQKIIFLEFKSVIMAMIQSKTCSTQHVIMAGI